MPLPIPNDEVLQYHISLVKNDALKGSSFEYEQYYDGPGNRAVTIIKDNNYYKQNEEVQIYVNGNQNERYTYVPAGEWPI